MNPTTADVVRILGLEPHVEGGYYRETFCSPLSVDTPRGSRPLSTMTDYLLPEGSVSRLHRIESDELWVFRGGAPLEVVTFDDQGVVSCFVLGNVLTTPGWVRAAGEAGTAESEFEMRPVVSQAVVAAGHWQGARVLADPDPRGLRTWAFVACLVSPGFVYEDLEIGDAAALTAAYPQHRALIHDFT
ncbi:MAG: cupin domain-containing protein [Thermoleophilia bacterium]